MPNTFFGLTIGKSGLYTYQGALNTTAHNIANEKTTGYSRQQTVRSATTALSLPGGYGMAGTGVNIDAVEQIRNEYYDVKYWNNTSVYGNYSTKEYYLTNIENYFSEVKSDGTLAAFDSFYTALSGLETSGGDLTMRTQVAETAQTFCEYVKYIYDGLTSIQDEANFEIKNTVDQINSIAEQLANLTKQINTIEVRGAKANDLRDARALLIDELSELANVTVIEQSIGDDVGVNQYIVRLDGKTLVDTYDYNTLVAVPQESSVNMNDVDGLYQLQWSNGQNFDSNSTTLQGKLKALFDVRDGNNKLNFTGTANGAKGDTTLTVTDANINDFNLLNIAAENGRVKIGAEEYAYDSFTAELDTTTGKITYTFTLSEALKSDAKDASLSVGTAIEYKGIPYYMAQLNEFVRTFATAFNEIHKSGTDYNGDAGVDFFTGKIATTGEDMAFDMTTDKDGNAVNLTVDSTQHTSYYGLTAGNFKVSETILANPKTIACAEDRISNGIEDTAVLRQLIELKSDPSMFKQGRPDSFLQTLVGVMGIDGQNAKNLTTSQDNIVKAIESQRMSVSGVDADEEAMDLVKFQSAYNLNSKVISIMNEVYDKLINETGV